MTISLILGRQYVHYGPGGTSGPWTITNLTNTGNGPGVRLEANMGEAILRLTTAEAYAELRPY
jgi:hypothetical protein